MEQYLSLNLIVVAIEKGAFESPLTKVASFTFFYLWSLKRYWSLNLLPTILLSSKLAICSLKDMTYTSIVVKKNHVDKIHKCEVTGGLSHKLPQEGWATS